MSQLKVFLCHSSKDKKIGALLKGYFERYFGFKVFLAHEDISPSAVWESEIIKSLKESSLVIPLISENFKDSIYANQELGMAIAWKKKIIPVKISNADPCGFISKLQAHKCSNQTDDELLETTTTVFFLVIENPRFNKRYKYKAVNSVVYALTNSDCFKTTRIIVKTLTKVDKKLNFYKEQVKNMLKAAKQNNQIYEEYYYFPDFKKLLESKYKAKFDS